MRDDLLSDSLACGHSRVGGTRTGKAGRRAQAPPSPNDGLRAVVRTRVFAFHECVYLNDPGECHAHFIFSFFGGGRCLDKADVERIEDICNGLRRYYSRICFASHYDHGEWHFMIPR